MNNVCQGLHFTLKWVKSTPINFEINDSGLYVLAKATYTVYGEKYSDFKLSNFRNAINFSFKRGFLSDSFMEVGLRSSGGQLGMTIEKNGNKMFLQPSRKRKIRKEK